MQFVDHLFSFIEIEDPRTVEFGAHRIINIMGIEEAEKYMLKSGSGLTNQTQAHIKEILKNRKCEKSFTKE